MITATPKSWFGNVPAPLFDELGREPRAFSSVCAFWMERALVRTDGSDAMVLSQLVSSDYYGTLGIKASMGRLVQQGDSEDVVVLAHDYWLHHFGGDPRVVGTSMVVNGVSRTIVGVTPRGFFGMDRAAAPDLTMPLAGSRSLENLWVVARRKPGTPLDQARNEVRIAWRRAAEIIRPTLSRWSASDRDEFLSQRADLMPADRAAGGMGFTAHLEVLRILALLSAVVLVVGCANISTLLLARATSRLPETGTRLALGATGLRLVRQAIVEGALLSVPGALLGTLFAFWAHRLLVAYLMGGEVPVGARFALDGRLFALMTTLSGLSAILSGLAPGLRASRRDVLQVLRRRLPDGGQFRLGFGRALIAGQVAASVLLLAVGVLLARTLGNLRGVEAGFAPEQLMVMTVGERGSGEAGPVVPAFYEDLLASARTSPGVVSASLAAAPILGANWNKAVWIDGRQGDRSYGVAFNVVTPGFFDTAGMRIVAGRDFSTHDRPGTPPVVIVNQAFARRFCPARQPLDCRFGDRGADSAGRYQVIGVVNDARHENLRTEPAPTVYEALLQEERATPVVLHVRGRGDLAALLALLPRHLRRITGSAPVYGARTLTGMVTESLRHERMMAALSGFFALSAVTLTCMGLFGTVAMAVGRRTREIGIRVALGARRAQVLKAVLAESLSLTAVGCVAGALLALASTRLLERLLFELSPTDPLTIAAAVVALLLVAGCSAYLPARRASAIDPAAALRHE